MMSKNISRMISGLALAGMAAGSIMCQGCARQVAQEQRLMDVSQIPPLPEPPLLDRAQVAPGDAQTQREQAVEEATRGIAPGVAGGPAERLTERPPLELKEVRPALPPPGKSPEVTLPPLRSAELPEK